MRIIAFVNRGSGGNEGMRVLHFLKNHLGDENVFDIKADKGPERGLDERASDPSIDVAVIVAGGDGTFSWVTTAIEKKNLVHCYLAVIPLGSGNDMSRSLGWGKKFPGLQRIEQWVENHLTEAPIQRMDVWRFKAIDSPNAPQSVDDDGIAHGLSPLMCNYLSFGADAYVELKFNQQRWKSPEKYKSRLGNFKEHFLIGAKYMCSPQSKKIRIVDHIETLQVDGELIHVPTDMQALIFLNIPNYGAGTQPWGLLGVAKPADLNKDKFVMGSYVDDRRFEVIGLRSLSQFGRIKMLGSHGVRIAQGHRMVLKLKSASTPFQVDGEPWEQHGGEVTLEPGNPVGIIQGPIWRDTSKKNAKFDPNRSSTEEETAETQEEDEAVTDVVVA